MRITITVDRFENDKAVLKTENGQTINWPKDKLPKEAKEGSNYNFLIARDPETEDEKKELAKNVLNELLQTEEDKE